MKARARQHPEQDLQRACVDILERFVPPPPSGPVFTAINPVPAKSKAVAGISRVMGLKRGFPDMHLLHHGRAIYVEFKAPKGRLSADQRARIAEIEDAGGKVYICRSVDEFLEILSTEGVPCRVSRP